MGVVEKAHRRARRGYRLVVVQAFVMAPIVGSFGLGAGVWWEWALMSLAAMTVAVGQWRLMPWAAVGFGWRLVPVAVVILERAGLAAFALWRHRAADPWGDLPVVLIVVAAALFRYGPVVVARTWRPGGGGRSLHLRFPLHDGRYVIGQGGPRVLNKHHSVLAQRAALDIVALADGRRARGILPAELDRYAVYGEPVYAPVAGTVLSAVDGQRDAPIGRPDPSAVNAAGNHVILAADGIRITLAHFQPGTVAVRAGDPVDEHTLLGRVGNSGNSTEPHLHLHAETTADDGATVLVHMLFEAPEDGRERHRNDVVIRDHREEIR